MRLVSFHEGEQLRAGVVVGDQVLTAGSLLGDGAQPSVRELLQVTSDRLGQLQDAAERAAAQGQGQPLQALRLGPPIPDPAKIICLGLNYSDHAAESALDLPVAPMLFAKYATSLIGPGAEIVMPAVSEKVDYEGELAVVIGRRAKEVEEDEALAHVGGYMPFNDVSARDLQLQTSQWMAGKAVDTFAPCGPHLVTADEVVDPHDLQITTRLNGQVVQDDSTAKMIFSIPRIIAFISSFLTLEPGDIIATGTPAGVGQKRTPPLFMGDGDSIEVEIERLGVLTNPVVSRAGSSRTLAATQTASP